MLKKIRTLLKRRTLRAKFLTGYLFCGILPVLLITSVFYTFSRNNILANAKSSLLSIIEKNNEIIDMQFERVEDAALMLTVNDTLKGLMEVSEKPSTLNMLHGNTACKKVLDQYFLGIPNLFSYHLYTDYYGMVGNLTDPTISSYRPSMYVPNNGFTDTELYRIAHEANGRLIWVPTYAFEQMYDVPEYATIDYNYPYLFSAVKQINCFGDDDGGRINPVLIVSYLPKFFSDILQSEEVRELSGYMCYIADENNRIVYNTGTDTLGQILPDDIAAVLPDAEGCLETTLGGTKSIVAYASLSAVRWKLIIIVPTSAYIGPISRVPFAILMASFALTGGLIAVSFFITNSMTKSLRTVVDGMNRLADGEFMLNLPVPQDAEMGTLFRKFNEMDQRIHTLIVENYEIRLHEKEAQIRALNLQLNPHFLYNTLSTINWMALDSGQADISRALVSLSQMLQQSYRTKGDFCTVEEDVDWLTNYINIMNLRYEDCLKVSVSINRSLLRTSIPRSMFQPLVENAIVHGYREGDEDFQIKVRGVILPDGRRRFSVADTGAGFNSEQVPPSEGEGSGVGLSNLKDRLRILYGSKATLTLHTAPGQGTLVEIELPA